MPTRIDHTTDPAADERLNPASELNAREIAALDQIEAGLQDKDDNLYNNPDSADINDSSKSADEKENNAQGFYQPSTKTKQSFKEAFTKGTASLKKRGALIGLATGVTSIGTILSFFGLGSLPITVVNAITETNDSASTVKEIRSRSVVNNMFRKGSNANDPAICSYSKIRCKSGKMSNRAIKKIAKATGYTPLDENRKPIELKSSGYPEKAPAYWSDENGNFIKTEDIPNIASKEGNEKLANALYGRIGAFKMRYNSWNGQHIKASLLNKFGLSRNGGVLNYFKDKKVKFNDKVTKIKEKIPKLDVGGVKSKFRSKIDSSVKISKRGGIVYLVGVAGCIGIKVPSYLGVAMASTEIVRVVATAFDTVLSPGSQIQAAGFDTGITPEQTEALGTYLTERGVTEGSKNTEGAAVDSQIFLAAMGAGGGKVALSQYVPGYRIFNNPIVKQSKQAAEVSEPVCNVLLSPAAMYATMAAEATVAVATGGISSLVSFLGKEVIADTMSAFAGKIISEVAGPVLQTLLENDMLPKARYKDLGDAVGVGSVAFFSSGAMAQMLPGLKNSQVSEFNKVQLANEEFQKKLDIASLSPFDTSSRHTFLGSISHNLNMMMLKNHTYNASVSSLVSNILRLPSFALQSMSPAHAKTGIFSGDYCGYAEDFGHSSDANTPAVNLAGMPCTGITSYQAKMSTDEAFSTAESEGWIDDTKDLPENATIGELIENGYIKKDTPLYSFIESCSDATSGNYWTEMTGCTAPGGSASGSQIIGGQDSISTGVKDSEGNDISYSANENEATSSVTTLDDKKLSAISVLLIDFQISQSINGEDEEREETTSDNPATDSAPQEVGTPENVDPAGSGWTLKPNTDYSGVPCGEGSEDAGVYDVQINAAMSKIRICTVTVSGSKVKIASIAVKNLKAMMEAAAAAGHVLTAQSDFRSSAEQARLRNQNCGGGNSCRVPTAKPGSSQHERGLAVDWGTGGKTFCFGSANCPAGSNPAWDWMMANASKYGFYKLKTEAWHFSTSGF